MNQSVAFESQYSHLHISLYRPRVDRCNRLWFVGMFNLQMIFDDFHFSTFEHPIDTGVLASSLVRMLSLNGDKLILNPKLFLPPET